jgi:uncharacterized protein (DUF488 family)
VPTVHTIGHGTSSQDELTSRLSGAGVTLLVDVRTAPGSRRHPHLIRAALERWLPAAGIDYRWEPRLGGVRRPPQDSPDVVWRNTSFRGYAAHLRTAEAVSAIGDLIDDAQESAVTIMCSETLWWRCHRRLIADVLVCVHGCAVRHLMPSGDTDHRPTPGARRDGHVLVYDAMVG